jgi:hypothetical protein
MRYQIVVWSAIAWIAVCLAPYLYALNDLITWRWHPVWAQKHALRLRHRSLKRRKKGWTSMATSARPVALITGASAGIGAALAH